MDSLSSSSAWIFYALASPLVAIIVNFGDKYIIEKHIRDTRAMSIYAGIVAFFSGCVLFVLTGFPTLPLNDMLLVMITGLMTAISAVLYFTAIARDETSIIIILIQARPVIVLVLSLIFLNDTISAQQLIGFVLIMGAAIAISLNRDGGSFKFSSALYLILICDLIWASSLVLFKFVVDERQVNALLPYESWGLALGDLLLYLFVPPIRRAFHASLKVVTRRALGYLAINETIFVASKVLGLTAIALGPVALVTVLGSVEVFYAVALGAILTTLAPAIFKEDISRANLLRKGALAIVLFGGIVLVK